jgi:hypothetical protein
VFIVESLARMKDLCGQAFSWACGTTVGVCYGPGIDSVGPHEFCHVYASKLWGPNDEKWLQEGLAVYADDRWQGYPLHVVAARLRAKGSLIPIASLLKNGWHTRYPSGVTYPELGSFVKFLDETCGSGALKRIWSSGARSIPEVCGKSLNTIEQNWLASIERPDARGIGDEPR